jgi:hypothetical protein
MSEKLRKLNIKDHKLQERIDEIRIAQERIMNPKFQMNTNAAEVRMIMKEKEVAINPEVWIKIYEISSNYVSTKEFLINNPNGSIPFEVYNQFFENEIDKAFQNHSTENKNEIFGRLLESDNPNINPRFFGILRRKLFYGFKDANSTNTQLYKVLLNYFGCQNTLIKWKGYRGGVSNRDFLGLYSKQSLENLKKHFGHQNVNDLLLTIAKNTSSHTPELVSRLLELSNGHGYLDLKKTLIESGSDCVPMQLLHKEVDLQLNSKKREAFENELIEPRTLKMVAAIKNISQLTYGQPTNELRELNNWLSFEEDGYAVLSSELCNLARTFNNLAKIGEYIGLQKNTKVANIEHEYEDGLSLHQLLDLHWDSSIPRLLIELRGKSNKINFRKREYLKHPIQYSKIKRWLEVLVRTLRVDILELKSVEGINCQVNFEYFNDILKRKGVGLFDGDESHYYMSEEIADAYQNRIVEKGKNPQWLLQKLNEYHSKLLEIQTMFDNCKNDKLTPQELQDEKAAQEWLEHIKEESTIVLTYEEAFEELQLIGLDRIENLSSWIFDQKCQAKFEQNKIQKKQTLEQLVRIFTFDQYIDSQIGSSSKLWQKVQKIQVLYNNLKAIPSFRINKEDVKLFPKFLEESNTLLAKLQKTYSTIEELTDGKKSELNMRINKECKDKIKKIKLFLGSKL